MIFYDEVLDLDFPQINPESELNEVDALAEKYLFLIKEILEKSEDEDNAVHLMGEFTFVYRLLAKLKRENIVAVCSTTRRIVTKENNGSIQKKFEFVRFRRYY